MKPEHDMSWSRVEAACTGPIRLLHIQHLYGDTYAIDENGGVSLSDKAHLIELLKQLTGREE